MNVSCLRSLRYIHIELWILRNIQIVTLSIFILEERIVILYWIFLFCTRILFLLYNYWMRTVIEVIDLEGLLITARWIPKIRSMRSFWAVHTPTRGRAQRFEISCWMIPALLISIIRYFLFINITSKLLVIKAVVFIRINLRAHIVHLKDVNV